jgi:hypothetical protein
MKYAPATLLLIVALLAASCGGEQSETGDARAASLNEASRTAEATPPQGDARRTADNRGSGTLRLGDTTYEFSVRACDFGEGPDDVYQTLTGRGTLPTGEPFDVFASRNEVNDVLIHTVSFQTGDVRRGQGPVLETQRMRSGGRWGIMPGEPNEPLIRITGSRLLAEGRFTPPDPSMPGEPVAGVLEAECRR